MGSITRTSSIERFVDAFGLKIESHFDKLVGVTIDRMEDKEVSYHVKATVVLKEKDGTELPFEVHHRWATQEEDASGEELTDYPMESYFEDFLKGKVVSKVCVGQSDRDDEVYLFLVVDDEEGCLEIPLGFNPEFGTVSDIAEELLSEEELNDFLKRN